MSSAEIRAESVLDRRSVGSAGTRRYAVAVLSAGGRHFWWAGAATQAIWIACAVFTALVAPSHAEEIRIDLDQRGDPHVTPRIRPSGFRLEVHADGHTAKLEATIIRIETRQQGHWSEPRVETGRYVKAEFDSENPTTIRIESKLKFDLAAGEQRFKQERDAIQKEAQARTAGKDSTALVRARQQLMMERIAAIRAENVKAGADPRGKTTRHAPPLPRQPLEFDKPEAIERILREECRWQSVAQVFKATGFPPPEEKEHSDFAASQAMAEEIQQAIMGVRGATHKFLSDGQVNALAENTGYHFSASFVPQLPHASADMLWKTAPAVRLTDNGIARARLEGTLDRQRGPLVEWWRVESDAPARVEARMTMGDGDCFWTWVEAPDPAARYIRVLLHSPATRYRLSLSLTGARNGEDVTIYDGPLDAPDKAPF